MVYVYFFVYPTACKWWDIMVSVFVLFNSLLNDLSELSRTFHLCKILHNFVRLISVACVHKNLST